jgi:isopentenyl phosphate kinase
MEETITVVKLGGSAITDKSKDCKPNPEIIHRSAEEIASYKGKLILLHGGGSYAHPLAMRTNLSKGYQNKSQLRAVSEIELQLEELSRIVGVSLLLRNMVFAPLRPMSFLVMNSGRVVKNFMEPIISALKLGIIPLIHGDIVFDRVRGFGIVSADRIPSLLAQHLNISRVLFGSDVDGVFTNDPKKNKRRELIAEVRPGEYVRVLRSLRSSSESDASHGMYGKVHEAIQLAQQGCEVYFFNLKTRNTLKNLLNNNTNTTGTRILPMTRRNQKVR